MRRLEGADNISWVIKWQAYTASPNFVANLTTKNDIPTVTVGLYAGVKQSLKY